jgi:hypothetical protein
VIEGTNAGQKSSTEEINTTTFNISDGSQEIVSSSMKISDALTEIKIITQKWDNYQAACLRNDAARRSVTSSSG